MAIEKVREYFAGCGMADRILEFDSSSATVELAAQALSCEPRRIAKSLSFMLGEEPILVLTAGDAKVDNAKYKAKFGKKAKMLTPDEVVQFIGHAIGGVCPFAVNDGVTYTSTNRSRGSAPCSPPAEAATARLSSPYLSLRSTPALQSG
mgnify:CR=1 FL=1